MFVCFSGKSREIINIWIGLVPTIWLRIGPMQNSGTIWIMDFSSLYRPLFRSHCKLQLILLFVLNPGSKSHPRVVEELYQGLVLSSCLAFRPQVIFCAVVVFSCWSIPGVSNLSTKCAKNLAKNLERAITVQFFVMFIGGLVLDLFFCKSLGVQIKMSNCAKKCTRAVGWTGLIYNLVLHALAAHEIHVTSFSSIPYWSDS